MLTRKYQFSSARREYPDENPARPRMDRTAKGMLRGLTAVVLIVCGLAATLAMAMPVHALQQVTDPSAYGSNQLFLPQISSNTDIATASCNATAEEAAIADLFLNDARQGRADVVCNPLLNEVARQRATDMAERGYFDHINPDGTGPNSLIRSAGYHLPAYYDQTASGNNVESIAAGFVTAEAAWTGWVNSPHHRSHVLAEEPFFADQTEYGIGYYYDPDSYYRYYWVLLTALPDSQ